MTTRVSITVSAWLAGVLAGPAPAAEQVGWWRFDEGTGKRALDASGRGHHGAIEGDVTRIEGVAGPGALDLRDGYVRIPDHPDLRPARFTVCLWVSLRGPQAAFARLLEKGDDNHEAINLQLVGRRVHFGFRDAGGGMHEVVATRDLRRVEAGWSFVAGVYDGTSLHLFIDGDPAGARRVDAQRPEARAGEALVIGARPPEMDRRLRGYIDEVRIYDGPLPPDAIRELYSWKDGDIRRAAPLAPLQGARGVPPDTILRWLRGRGARAHDVYLGTGAAAVRDAGPGSPAYRGRRAGTRLDPGLLAWGKTYRWRVDAIGADGVRRGEVWRFTVAEGRARHPRPRDGAVLVPVRGELAWHPGPRAREHDVYFGRDGDAVRAAARGGAAYRGTVTRARFDPGPLERAATYYWRIDERGDAGVARGRVWRFTTETPIAGLSLRVDLALPRWGSAEPLPETAEPGWTIWAAPRWADMYSHDFVTLEDIAGTGVKALLTLGNEGQGALKVRGLRMHSKAGEGPPTGVPRGDPICNSWYQAADWASYADGLRDNWGNILLVFWNLPAGEYWLYSFHNHFYHCDRYETSCLGLIGRATRAEQGPMPSITVHPLPPEPLAGYDKWSLPPGPGRGVTAIREARDVTAQHLDSDEDLVPSLVRFKTDGSPVLVIYDSPKDYYDYRDYPGGRAILNAFRLDRVRGDPGGRRGER